jgi:hypothetical protein
MALAPKAGRPKPLSSAQEKINSALYIVVGVIGFCLLLATFYVLAIS